MIKDRIKHDGKVTEVTDTKVVAEILVSEACGSCQAKGLCHTQGKRVSIEASRPQGTDFNVGDSVDVCMKSSLAMSSVLLAYVLPLVLMFAVMIALMAVTGNQDMSCLIGLATLPLYYTVLYLMRDRLKRNFDFEITHKMY